MPEKKSGIATIAEPFVCGGSAATFASVIIHPMDLAKASDNVLLTYSIYYVGMVTFTQIRCNLSLEYSLTHIRSYHMYHVLTFTIS